MEVDRFETIGRSSVEKSQIWNRFVALALQLPKQPFLLLLILYESGCDLFKAILEFLVGFLFHFLAFPHNLRQSHHLSHVHLTLFQGLSELTDLVLHGRDLLR